VALAVAAVLVGAVAVLLQGGDKKAAPVKLSGSHALLSGRVVDGVTKSPLAAAVIRIDQAGGPLSLKTDAKGFYSSVVDVSRPIGLTIDASAHQGAVAFGKLCPGERRDLTVALPPAHQKTAPPAPMVLQGKCR